MVKIPTESDAREEEEAVLRITMALTEECVTLTENFSEGYKSFLKNCERVGVPLSVGVSAVNTGLNMYIGKAHREVFLDDNSPSDE